MFQSGMKFDTNKLLSSFLTILRTQKSVERKTFDSYFWVAAVATYCFLVQFSGLNVQIWFDGGLEAGEVSSGVGMGPSIKG